MTEEVFLELTLHSEVSTGRVSTGQIEVLGKLKDWLVGDCPEAANFFANLRKEALVGRILALEDFLTLELLKEDIVVFGREVSESME